MFPVISFYLQSSFSFSLSVYVCVCVCMCVLQCSTVIASNMMDADTVVKLEALCGQSLGDSELQSIAVAGVCLKC